MTISYRGAWQSAKMELRIEPIGEIPKKEILKCPNPECDQRFILWLVDGRIEKMTGASGKEEVDSLKKEYKRYFECMECGVKFAIKKK